MGVSTASYHASGDCDFHASRACVHTSPACGRAVQAETEAECAESDESVANASMSAAIIEGK